MKIRVDSDLCEGYATCVDIAPDLFQLDEWGYAFVEGDGEVPPDREEDARRAVLECPMNAILYTE
jgi:ferredoxin